MADIYRAADHILNVCEAAAIEHADPSALLALQQRSPYTFAAARPYNKGLNELVHHVDGMGNWVVLFSFGLTVDFFVGHRTVCIESGDALVFNGGAAHGVVHGFAHAVRSNATYK